MSDDNQAVYTTRRLDVLAQALIGTVAAVAGLLTVLGANSDRVWALLDDDSDQRWLVAAAVLAVLTVGLSLAALVLASRPAIEAAILAIAGLMYVAALVTALYAAARAADTPGRPTFGSISLTRTDSSMTVLSFVVHADNVDPDQRIAVDAAAGDRYGEELLFTTLRPSPLGQVRHEATLVLPEDVGPGIRIRAVRTDAARQECTMEDSFAAPTCLWLTPP